jgi:hypothetical protein
LRGARILSSPVLRGGRGARPQRHRAPAIASCLTCRQAGDGPPFVPFPPEGACDARVTIGIRMARAHWQDFAIGACVAQLRHSPRAGARAGHRPPLVPKFSQCGPSLPQKGPTPRPGPGRPPRRGLPGSTRQGDLATGPKTQGPPWRPGVRAGGQAATRTLVLGDTPGPMAGPKPELSSGTTKP